MYGGNAIMNGPLSGRTLDDAAALWGAGLLGAGPAARYGSRFPLLTKFIDAAHDLSLQVHPADRHVRADGQLGKAEAWLILDAAAGSAVYWGFRAAVSTAQVREAVSRGTLQELLNHVPVAAGDVVYNPPGTVHAIGSGILLFEIQQASDITYRLYDWERRDSSGQLRQLHLEEALAVASLSGGGQPLVSGRQLRPGERQLLACEYFVLNQLDPVRAGTLTTSQHSVELLTAVHGPVTLRGSEAELKLPAGTSLVLPAVTKRYGLSGSGQLLRGYLPH